MPGTQDVFAERVVGGHYLDIEVNRPNAARYGVTVADVENLVQSAIGGENISTMIAGRERFPINLRYPRELRGSLGKNGSEPGDACQTESRFHCANWHI